MTSKYQKRHYEDVAKLLRNALRQEITNGRTADESLAFLHLDFADLFAADNPLFDRERFLKACGLEDNPWNEAVDGLADAIEGLKS